MALCNKLGIVQLRAHFYYGRAFCHNNVFPPKGVLIVTMQLQCFDNKVHCELLLVLHPEHFDVVSVRFITYINRERSIPDIIKQAEMEEATGRFRQRKARLAQNDPCRTPYTADCHWQLLL